MLDDIKPDVTLENEQVVEEVKEEKEVEELKFLGFVRNCKRLNVRKRPSKSSEVLCVIEEGDEVKYTNDRRYGEFYRVVLKNGVEGFCMKKFIELE